MDVAIFPGHVGKDCGAVDTAGAGDDLHSVEATITACIASKLALLLSMMGIDHRLLPGSFDYRIAASDGCTVGLSIHCDSLPADTGIHGYHAIYYPGSERALELAHHIHNSMALIPALVECRKPHSRRDLAILRRTSFPVVLIECGFLSNTDDEARLMHDVHQSHLAFAMVEALRRWA